MVCGSFDDYGTLWYISSLTSFGTFDVGSLMGCGTLVLIGSLSATGTFYVIGSLASCDTVVLIGSL